MRRWAALLVAAGLLAPELPVHAARRSLLRTTEVATVPADEVELSAWSNLSTGGVQFEIAYGLTGRWALAFDHQFSNYRYTRWRLQSRYRLLDQGPAPLSLRVDLLLTTRNPYVTGRLILQRTQGPFAFVANLDVGFGGDVGLDGLRVDVRIRRASLGVRYEVDRFLRLGFDGWYAPEDGSPMLMIGPSISAVLGRAWLEVGAGVGPPASGRVVVLSVLGVRL